MTAKEFVEKIDKGNVYSALMNGELQAEKTDLCRIILELIYAIDSVADNRNEILQTAKENILYYL